MGPGWLRLNKFKILRTIELPVNQPKKQNPVGSSTGKPNDNSERHKRKRIKKDTGTPIKPEKVQGAGNVGPNRPNQNNNNNKTQHARFMRAFYCPKETYPICLAALLTAIKANRP